MSEKPDGMGDWTYLAIVAWCWVKAVFLTTYLVARYPLTFKDEAERRGFK